MTEDGCGARDPWGAPPWSARAEASVLAAMMGSPEAAVVIAGELAPDEFYKPAHRALFETIKLLVSRGEGNDPISVIDELERQGRLAAAGGDAYVLEVAGDALAGLSWSHHVQIVKRRAASRRVLAACAALGERAVAPDADARTLVADAVAELMAAQDGAAIAPARGIADLLDAGCADAAVPSGIAELDAFAGGLPRGGVTVIAGPSGSGKSGLVDDIALGAAVRGAGVAVFSLDARAPLRARSIGRGCDRARDLAIAIDDSPAPSIEQVESRARRMMAASRCDVVAIDYVQLMDLRGARAGEPFETCGVRRLKGVAARLDAAVVSVAHTSSPAHVRACAEHADLAISLTGCRDGYRGRVVKNRLGGVGELSIPFDDGTVEHG